MSEPPVAWYPNAPVDAASVVAGWLTHITTDSSEVKVDHGPPRTSSLYVDMELSDAMGGLNITRMPPTLKDSTSGHGKTPQQSPSNPGAAQSI